MNIVRYLIGLFIAGFITVSCKPDSSSPISSPQNSVNDTLLVTSIYSRWFELESVRITNVELHDHLNRQINMREIVNNSPKLVFFFSEISCFECVSKQVDFLSKFISDSVNIPSIFISTSQNLRSVYALLMERGMDLPYYSSNFENIGFDRNKHPGPLFFILDSTSSCKFIYEPNIHMQQITHQYLHKVYNMFFSSQ